MSASLDAALITAGQEFFELLTEYDRVTDWVSVESATLVRRLGEVKELIFLHSPPQTFAGAAVQLRCLREMMLRDWDDYLVEAPRSRCASQEAIGCTGAAPHHRAAGAGGGTMIDGIDRDPFALAGHAGEGDARVLALFHDYLAACQEMDRSADVDEGSWQKAYERREEIEAGIIATLGGPVALAIKTYLSYRIEGSQWAPKVAMLRDPALLEGVPDITVSQLRDAAGLVRELAELAAPIIHEDAVLIDADIEVQWCREIKGLDAATRLPRPSI